MVPENIHNFPKDAKKAKNKPGVPSVVRRGVGYKQKNTMGGVWIFSGTIHALNTTLSIK